MDNRKKGANGQSSRPGEYEMLDHNMNNAYGSPNAGHPTGQPLPQYAGQQGSVSRSDLDVLETTAAPEAYAYDGYSGYPAQGGHPAGYAGDAGVGYFHQDDSYSQHQMAYAPDYASEAAHQQYKPLPTPHTLPIHEPRSLTSTPVMADDGDDKERSASQQKIDPRIMPEPSPLVSGIYDNQAAPPPGARKFKRFQSQRRRRVKAIELTAGNVVLDCPVPRA
ncbi:hypothetical protein GGI11_008246, partial [Coemansia sp. RSA 2049]